MAKKIQISFFILFFPLILLSNNQDIKFERISDEQGFSENAVCCTIQDHKGFLWIGTDNGLFKYDGYKFINYSHDQDDSSSLNIYDVVSLYETHYNRIDELWIGAFGRGLYKLNLETEKFTGYLHNPNNPNSLSNNRVSKIYEEKTGVLWIGTWGGGLNRFDQKTEQFTHFLYDADNPYSISHNYVTSIHKDHSGVLWIGTFDGLNKLNQETGQFTHFKHDPNNYNSLSNDTVYAIYETHYGGIHELWIGTRDGLNRFDYASKKFTVYRHNPNDPKSLSNSFIWSINGALTDGKNDLWVGATDGWLNKFEWETEQFIRYFPNPGNGKPLSNNDIRSIYEDNSGVLWIGIFGGGLIKFKEEKNDFIHYKHDPNNSNSLSSNAIRQIYEDKTGDLWIATYSGLNRFDRGKKQFFQYKHDSDNPTSLSNNSVFPIYEDKAGVLWIGTYDGLNVFDRATGQFTHFKHDSNDPFSLSHNNIRSIYEDKRGVLWIGTWGGGLNRFDRNTGQFTYYKHDGDNINCISDNNVLAITETNFDDKNILWIGTKRGLNSFDPITGKFTRYYYDPRDPSSLSNNTVWSICEALNKEEKVLWLGTNAGLNRFDLVSGNFSRFREKDGLQNKIIYGISLDKQNNLWLTTQQGLSKFDPKIKIFKNYDSNDNILKNGFNNRLYTNTAVSNIATGGRDLTVATDGTIFLACLEDGLRAYTYDGVSFSQNAHFAGTSGKVYDVSINQEGLVFTAQDVGGLGAYSYDGSTFINIANIYNGGKARALALDTEGTIFLASLDDGLRAYRFNGTSFANTAHTIKGGRCSGVTIGSDGTIFVADRDSGLFAYEYDGSAFTKIAGICQGSSAYDVAVGLDGTIFLANYYGGLRAYRHTGTSFSNTAHIYDGGINGGRAFRVIVGSDGTIYLGNGEDGLRLYSCNGASLTNIAHIYDEGEVWGIAEAPDGTVYIANVDEGVWAYSYNGTSFLLSNDNQMYFGGPNGLVTFSPESLERERPIPQVIITDFQIYNKTVLIERNNSIEAENIRYLPKHISYVEEIELSYKENIFSFEFAGLDYHNPNKNRYAYKMEGVDPEWINTDASRRFANYTQLDPGEYVFRVKGSNSMGVWNEEGASIKIIITPPWWQTGWAYIIYVMFLLSIVYGIWRFQTNRLKMKQQMEMEHFEAEKLREVDHMKSRFFANISHEFRTPLTLIQGPVKQMLSGEFTGNLKEQYMMILRYSGRLLNLINQILDLSKLDFGLMTLKVSHTDVSQFLRCIVQYFCSLAERQEISLKFNCPDGQIMGYVDRDKLEKIVTNLLSNAFKFTPEGGEIEVRITPTPHSISPLTKGGMTGGVDIRISNTGPGIPPERLDNIFDRFYQVDDTYKKDSEGSGIGLALTKEVVKACYGEIRVESEPNELTTFSVVLPICKENFRAEEIVELETGDRRPQTGIPPLSSIEYPVSSIEYPESSIEETEVQYKSSGRLPLLLIVEDNPDVIRHISGFLVQDYRIISAENGEEGWKKALRKFPDMVISDVMMPVMDGFEMCRKLKSDERTSHIPVILLTARGDMDSKLEGLEFGADDYLTKPFDAKELQVRSKNLLEQRCKLREKFEKKLTVVPYEITVSSLDEKFISRALQIIENNISDPEFGVAEFSKEVRLSRAHLYRKLQALTGQSVKEFIRTIRLKRAALLLQQGAGNITEIAYEMGFNSSAYFTKCFRKQFGSLPSKFTSGNSN